MRRLSAAAIVAAAAAVAGVVLAGCGGKLSSDVFECGGSSPDPSVAGQWVLTDLGTLGGQTSGAAAITDQGKVVGWSKTKLRTETGDLIPHAFLWEDGKMRDLGALKPGGDSSASAINDKGQVVGSGWVYEEEGSYEHALLWESGSVHDLAPAPPFRGDSSAIAINRRGQIVLHRYPAIGNASRVIWENGKIHRVPTALDPYDINDRGDLVGAIYFRGAEPGTEESHAAVAWGGGTVRDLGTLGGSTGKAAAINERGQIVGSSETTAGELHAFMWEKGKMRDLGTLGGRDSRALDINDRGQVVGWAETPTGSRGFLWQNGVMASLGCAGEPIAINDRGEIVGSNMHAVMWTWQPTK
jgi:probable HAF family extracellular repeat protein